MPMSKLEAYLTADMRVRVRLLNKKALIFHFERISTAKCIEDIANWYCIGDATSCRAGTPWPCNECWELAVRTVLSKGGPVL